MGDLENDMDELFRKAANHYPLKTDGADWDKLMRKLPDAVGTPLPDTEQKAGNTNKKLLWLILLFPMGWLCNSYYNNGKKNESTSPKVVSVNSTKKIDDPLQYTNNQNNKTNNQLKVNDLIPEKKYIQPRSALNKATLKKGLTIYSNPNNPSYANAGKKQLPYSSVNLRSGNVVEKNNFGDDKTNDGMANKKEVENDEQLVFGTNPPLHTPNIIHNNTDTNTILVNSKKDNIRPQNSDTTKNVAKKTNNKRAEKNSGFYISPLGGLDASSVKSQGVKKTGYSFGLLIGYQLSKHFALETGLLWGRKKYYTGGEFFDKTRTGIPSNYTISNINGSCNMFEVPIDFRYNLAQNKKELFFATAGLSSYFMKKESYNYDEAAWGSIWPAMKTYTNSGNNLFSIINLSVGLEHKINKSISLRINPYLKIPLKGLGIGSIPITSSGINIGITVPFHK